MNLKKGVPHHQRFWTIGLTVALILLGQFLIAGAQTAKPQITTNGADDTFQQSLSQPTQFLKRLGITAEEIQKQLRVHPRIVVDRAGAVRNLGMVSFTSAQLTQSNIQVEGVGAARVVGLASFTEVQDQQSSKPDIHVAGAGSVRNLGLVAPVGQ